MSIEQIKNQMCNKFCRIPKEASDKEESEAFCSICPLNDLVDMSKSINDLRRVYTNEIENLEEDAQDNNSLCNTYNKGKMAAYSHVLYDLEEVMNE